MQQSANCLFALWQLHVAAVCARPRVVRVADAIAAQHRHQVHVAVAVGVLVREGVLVGVCAAQQRLLGVLLVLVGVVQRGLHRLRDEAVALRGAALGLQLRLHVQVLVGQEASCE